MDFALQSQTSTLKRRLRYLRPGDAVKVRPANTTVSEILWVIVSRVSAGALVTGRVDSFAREKLHHGLDSGDLVDFFRCHCLAVYRPTPICWPYSLWILSFVSRCARSLFGACRRQLTAPPPVIAPVAHASVPASLGVCHFAALAATAAREAAAVESARSSSRQRPHALRAHLAAARAWEVIAVAPEFGGSGSTQLDNRQ